MDSGRLKLFVFISGKIASMLELGGMTVDEAAEKSKVFVENLMRELGVEDDFFWEDEDEEDV